MTERIDGKSIATRIEHEIARDVLALQANGIRPTLAVIFIGDNAASALYIRLKKEAAKRVGIIFTLHHLPATATTAEIVAFIQHLQATSAATGIIVQLPTPAHIDISEVLNTIHTTNDIDCLTDTLVGKLVMNTAPFLPPTVAAVMEIFASLQIQLPGKNVTIVGAGPLVGRPLAITLMHAGATVTVCNSNTQDLSSKTMSADIVVMAVGKKDLLRGDMIRQGAIVIDTGVDIVDNVMYGDIHYEEIRKKAAFVTPTPGGVGPITIAKLLANVVACAKIHQQLS